MGVRSGVKVMKADKMVGGLARGLDVRKVVPTFSKLTDLMAFDRIWLN